MSQKIQKTIYRLHPWHGVSQPDSAPEVVVAYIEMVPTDVVKYEIDKISGILKVDRPQKYSSQSPVLYGFLPQTYCGSRVGKFCVEKSGRPGIEGDGDPLDVCVISERPIQHGDVLLRARPIGGLRMIDRDQADDKIIAVLEDDGVYGHWREVGDCPLNLIERLKHYFLSYKDLPGQERRKVEIPHVYGKDEAFQVIEYSREDYKHLS